MKTQNNTGGLLNSDQSNSISALLPVRDGEKYLDELIPSVLRMLRPDDNFIIIDDGSMDATDTIILKYEKQDARVVRITTPGIGLVNSLNLGVEKSDKPWVARFDVDDLYVSSRLEDQRNLISPEVAIIFSDYGFITKKGLPLGTVYSGVLPTPTLLSLILSQRTAHPSALINRKLLIKVGGYSNLDFPVEDLSLWFKISQYGKLVTSPKKLLYYRLHGASISARNRIVQISKKNTLVKNYPNWLTLYNQSLDSLAATLQIYLKLNGGPTRILLHLRELQTVANLLKIKLPLWPILKLLGPVLILRIFAAFLSLLPPTFARRCYRFLHKIPINKK